MKIKCNIFVYIPGTGLWESLASSEAGLLVMDVPLKWCSAKPPPLLAEESQEDKWLSFKFQEEGRGDRQCECHSLCSIDFSASDVKKSPGSEASRKSTD